VIAGPDRRRPSGGAGPVRVGDTIARALRERILTNQFPDGLLASQEALMAEFGVSAPSIREALRILEAEGLITVRRGNVGGAVVHVPDASSTAHALGLALQSDGVTLADVSEALCAMDAWAAAACARRADRATAVTPRLTARVADADAVIASADWLASSLRFHTDLADLSGNGTFRLLISSLLSLWQAHADEWMNLLGHATYVSAARRRKMSASHRELISVIASGDAAAAQAAAERHMRESHQVMLKRQNATVSVTRVGIARSRAR
jgi:GntR family transcriptional regulator, transcriptional repressor for pyruvate dehydrogenase complex